MERITKPPRGSGLKIPMHVVHLAGVLLFVATWLTFLLMAFFIRNFAAPQPGAAHSFPVHEHGGTLLLGQALGKLYVNMPWMWLTTFGAGILVSALRFKKRSA
jgi:hypothetical protein